MPSACASHTAPVDDNMATGFFPEVFRFHIEKHFYFLLLPTIHIKQQQNKQNTTHKIRTMAAMAEDLMTLSLPFLNAFCIRREHARSNKT